ncbi:Hsp33 family molecular chaperone HslO [Reyranella sp. CPCC 100927]|uniref:Hsp33 family molecular chaperone HslO n=1 Tax=Reyranella sp. CPCC 100927 TaxID=2599616 RepID=UPI0011B4884F|nr:Hsp33 family molecular chaperone HslO [Reyranella sp. CPCC 100927]TWT01229.1 molecular chaperone Hsp33 [Reyranella sp. CPCC 100927]
MITTRAGSILAAHSDSVLPFQLEALGVRGRAVRLGPVLDTILSRHAYPTPVAALLAEALVLGAALASALKYDGIFTLQLRGDGPVRLIVVDLTSDGALRGYAQVDAKRLDAVLADAAVDPVSGLPSSPVPRLLGAGHMAFTVDQGPQTERYQGVVALDGATLADCAHHYFRQSEQLAAGLKLAVAHDGTHWRAAALLLQALPSAQLVAELDADEREDRWRKAVVLLGSATAAEMVDQGLPVEGLLLRLFHEDGVRAFDRRPLYDQCRCSRARIDRVLRTIRRSELDELRDTGGRVVVTCEFCSTAYRYADADLDALETA